MRPSAAAPAITKPNSKPWLLFLILLGASLIVLFYQSFLPHEVLFANDTPLGFLKSESDRLPDRFSGTWHDLSWLGGAAPTAAPTLTAIFSVFVSPEFFLKTYAPLTVLLVGFSAWAFFRSLQFNSIVCALGGVAAGLNMHFFSIACWGLGTWNIAAAMAFLAMASISSKSIKQLWAKCVLAGLAVGMAVMEGFDVGAILSVYVAAFLVLHALTQEEPLGKRVAKLMMSEVLMVIFAVFIGAHTISSLVQTQIEGVASMEQDVQTKQQRWNAATQWSLPKAETLQLFVPGLFGYRMSQHILNPDHSSAYWGEIGQDPRIAKLGSDDPVMRKETAAGFNVTDEMRQALNTPNRHDRTDPMHNITKKAGIYWRYSGSGEFAGIVVMVLALFGIGSAFKAQAPYSKKERIAVFFWTAVAVFSLLTAWGRYGFIYQILYHLPYFSTIRNPIKFLHPFHIAWIILAAYGMESLYRIYLRSAAKRPAGQVAPFDRKWIVFAYALVGVCAAGLFAFYSSHNSFIVFLEDQSFTSQEAAKIADFAFQESVWFVVYLVLAVLVVNGIVKGALAGPRAKMAWTFIAILMIADLGRADQRWVRYFDYSEKYSPNPIVDFLQDQPYNHRVIGKLEPRGPGSGITPGFGELYFFWIQNDFPYHNIQTLDFSQMPHIPDLDRLYLKNFELKGTDVHQTDLFPAIRLWQLTNTRYLLATASGVDLLNDRAGPDQGSFHIRTLFNMERKPGIGEVDDVGDITIREGERGQYAMIEFNNALPRVKLYSNWQVETNDDVTLNTLLQKSFNPSKVVLVSQTRPQDPAVAAMPTAPEADPGTATIAQYHPKFVQIQADAKVPSLLLLNDRIAPDWQVRIDHQPAKILRCNYIMRGVYLTPGTHTIEFRYKPSLKTLYITLCAIGVGIALAGYLIGTRTPSPSSAPVEKTQPAPAPAPSPSPSPAAAQPVAKAQKLSKGNRKSKARR
jgi:hypothetical protein